MNRLLLCSLLVAAGTRCLTGAILKMSPVSETGSLGSQLSINADLSGLAGLISSDASHFGSDTQLDIRGFGDGHGVAPGIDGVEIFERLFESAPDLNSTHALDGRRADEGLVAFERFLLDTERNLPVSVTAPTAVPESNSTLPLGSQDSTIILKTHRQYLLLACLGIACFILWGYTYHLGGRTRLWIYSFDFGLGACLASLLYAVALSDLGRRASDLLENLSLADNKALATGIAAASMWAIGCVLFMAAASEAGLTVAYSVAAALWVALSAGIPPLANGLNRPSVPVALLLLLASAIVCYIVYTRRLPPPKAAEPTYIWADTKVGLFSDVSLATKIATLSASAGLLMAAFFPLANWSRDIEPLGLGPASLGLLAGVAVAFVGLSLLGFLLYTGRLRVQDIIDGPIHKRLLGFAGGVLSTTGLFAILLTFERPRFGPFNSAAVAFALPFGGALLAVTACRELPPSARGMRSLTGIMVLLQMAAPVLLWIGIVIGK